MDKKPIITYSGIDGNAHKRPAYTSFKKELTRIVTHLHRHEDIDGIHIQISSSLSSSTPTIHSPTHATDDNRSSYEHTIKSPLFSFTNLMLPKDTMESLLVSIKTLTVSKKVFDDFGLKEIEPNPRVCLNFFGPPGTGKTMAAHALAAHFNKRIMEITYGDIVSKYFGEGAQNIKQIFDIAEKNDVILFIDEADSLLSKRLVDTSQSAGQAINSMRSQILTSIEKYNGIVIFATNLIENYDHAFETRIKHIAFKMPDDTLAKKIWEVHLVPKLPLSGEVTAERLATEFSGICGRDIKNIVIQAAVRAAVEDSEYIDWNHFDAAHREVLNGRWSDLVTTNVEFSNHEINEIKRSISENRENINN